MYIQLLELISRSNLELLCYVKFRSGSFSLYTNSSFIGSDVLINGLCRLKLENVFVESVLTMHCNIRFKHSMVNVNSIYVWHKPLSNISKEIFKRL